MTAIKGSGFLKLNKEDWKKIGIGALVAIGGVLATYLETLIPSIDFGNYTTLVVAINGIVINIIRKLVTDYSAK
jgi:hypothetical protein